MKEFQLAAQQAVDDQNAGEESLLEFGLAGQEFTARRPTSGQVALVASSFDGGNTQMVTAIFTFLEALLQGDGYRRLRKLVANGTVPFEVLFGGDENNATGIVEWIASEATARPTQPPADSSPSPTSDGQRSTGRSPGKGSIRSTSTPGSS